ncbi:MAG: SDR family NAD(P)-dependent oxidoreductase, partial [Prevotella sp.]|nr:SDR family NAD(P)-dependent oxidoreductase [Prevotella sp.]
MNKTVLITGATSGIGLGCARKFAENGDRLILTGRNAEKLEAIKGELEEKGCQVLTLVFDVRDRAAATEAIESLPEQWRDIDVL